MTHTERRVRRQQVVAAIKADPLRSCQEIAAEFGLSADYVSWIVQQQSPRQEGRLARRKQRQAKIIAAIVAEPWRTRKEIAARFAVGEELVRALAARHKLRHQPRPAPYCPDCGKQVTVRGKRCNRCVRHKTPNAKISAITEAIRSGKTQTEVARELHCSFALTSAIAKKLRAEGNPIRGKGDSRKMAMSTV